jgi:hypothetical protein
MLSRGILVVLVALAVAILPFYSIVDPRETVDVDR